MDDLILKRCKYCDKTYEGTSESCCCSEPCNIKYQKYMKQREKTETPVKIFSIILLLIFFINIMFLPNNPISKYLFIAISLIVPALHVIFPFGEDKGLQKRGVKKTKILFRTIWGTVLIYILTYYFLEQF
ncbi:hypothetical protein QTI69_04695 [Clostridium perfringens]|uniref:hypothetical protein n=1 Tax=Clostridium perfringens TaxID=1502 RepID=UPI002903DB91|nr:hypothetical protein [Clostridium perfringens]EHK2403093.1 hypothetical protein [Clostridium perfringens]MDM0890275.1 hypothetical protein [Clostridium perfringens]MDM0893623.1 hypothetical protein [Clostridium perfringens]MDU1212250.1 hypothetical protein [Clostridium perfringens]MDZ5021940.1 hypothetical protein [Clostridium perfringens]